MIQEVLDEIGGKIVKAIIVIIILAFIAGALIF